MIPFIPNDKCYIGGLTDCWKYIRENISSVEISYFVELASITYELFSNYNSENTIPKEFISLIAEMGRIDTLSGYEKYSASDIIKEVSSLLLHGFSEGYFGKEKEHFHVLYDNEMYCLNAKTFDISPIINRH